jgi:general secretion pathway protein H
MLATGKVELHPQPDGFTLFEMLVVLAVAGLVSGIMFPAVERSIDQQRFRMAAYAVETALREARARAIGQAQPTRFSVAPDQRRYRTANGSWVDLPQSMVLTGSRNDIAFYDDGTATGGMFMLADAGRRKIQFSVDASTGLVKIMRP